MTELEKKAQEYAELKVDLATSMYNPRAYELVKQAYLDGYEQGQKDFDNDVTKILNKNDISFIDCDSIGGVIGLCDTFTKLQKENEELEAKLDELKCCENCANIGNSIYEEPCFTCKYNTIRTNDKDNWE